MKIIGIDAETDGLYGPIWAIGMCVLSEDGRVDSNFGVRTSYEPSDEWVRTNIWPVCQGLPTMSRTRMHDEFWNHWRDLTDKGWITIADFGAPVEARLFRDMIADDRSRWFQGPYPLHELATALLLNGYDPDIARETLAERVGMVEFVKHNPVHDAEMTARTFYALFSGRLKAKR